MRLTAKQVEEVRAPSVKYPATAYTEVLAALAKSGKPEGKIEEKFPGVKPAHVAHMLKGAAATNGAQVEIVVHGTYGVCVLPPEEIAKTKS